MKHTRIMSLLVIALLAAANSLQASFIAKTLSHSKAALTALSAKLRSAIQPGTIRTTTSQVTNKNPGYQSLRSLLKTPLMRIQHRTGNQLSPQISVRTNPSLYPSFAMRSFIKSKTVVPEQSGIMRADGEILVLLLLLGGGLAWGIQSIENWLEQPSSLFEAIDQINSLNSKDYLKNNGWQNHNYDLNTQQWHERLAHIQEMIEANPRILEQQDCLGNTPLIKAAEKGNTELLSLLLEYTPEVNAVNTSGATALMQAIWLGHNEVAKILIDRPGISIFLIKDRVGLTAYDYAIKKNNHEIIDYIDWKMEQEEKALASMRKKDEPLKKAAMPTPQSSWWPF